MLVYRLPGPETMILARRTASRADPTHRGAAGTSETRRMPAPDRIKSDSPSTIRPSSSSADNVTCSAVAGSTRPRAPTTRPAISTARVKSRVTSFSAVSTRFPSA